MAVAAVLLVRYRILFYPAVAFLTFVVVQIFRTTRQHLAAAGGAGTSSLYLECLPPIAIFLGLVAMRWGRREVEEDGSTGGSEWTLLFWLGEATVIASFTYNSCSSLPKTPILIGGISTFAAVASLWFRGRLWNYLLVIGLEVFLAIFVALSFPVIEMILDSILNEKLKKVGDKVRVHHEILEVHYKAKLEKMKQQSPRS